MSVLVAPSIRRGLARIAVASVVVAVLAIAVVLATPTSSRAQTPPTSPTATPEVVLSDQQEAQALAVEHRLLCPQCTNERLDVCENAICHDMKRLIRQRIAAGDSSDQIVAFFANSYGERVLAELPRRGFNLWLWAWVGGSVVMVAGFGAWWLASQRARAHPAAAPPLGERDEQWLDEELRRGGGPAAPGA